MGASHQTGWTGLVAILIQNRGTLDAAEVLKAGKRGAFVGNKLKGPEPAGKKRRPIGTTGQDRAC